MAAGMSKRMALNEFLFERAKVASFAGGKP